MPKSLLDDPAPAASPPPPYVSQAEPSSAAGAPASGNDRSPRRFSAIPVAVLVASLVAAAAAFGLTSSVVRDQERRLLSERGDEVKALVANAFSNIESSLRVLGGVGSSPDPAAARLFTEGATPLVTRGVVAVGVAAERNGAFVVATAVGDTPVAGQALDTTRATLARRAVAEKKMVSGLRAEGERKRLMLALPVASGRAVAYQESVVDPAPRPSTPDSPFRELRVVLYATERPDPSQLVVTTEAEVPLRGRVERVPFKVGADTWLLAVAARGPLVGALTEKVPWFLLAGGLAMGLLATAVAQTLARRRTFALDLVEKRTAELETALGELAETRAFLDRMLTSGPVLVLRAHVGDDQVTYASPNIERLYGLSPADARAAGFLADRVHPEDLPAFNAALARAAEGDSGGTLEYRFRHGDGSHRWTSGVFVADVQDAAGADGHDLGAGGDERPSSAVLIYILDVEDRRQADQARREAQEAAETANRAKSQFLSRMSHELRTPLNAVLGFGQLLELQGLTTEQQEYVGYIVKGGRHLLDLINEVLDISRVEAGELALSPEAVLASGLVQETVDLMRPLADQRGIQMVVDRSGSCDCYVFADRQRAKQILLNLLSNAVKYNRPRGTIAISCQPSSDTRMTIKVTDTGHGIPGERLGQLFTPFDRLGAENTDVEGTGIGLALSQRLAEVMGGTLVATSTLGQGSTFFVELPLVEGPVERYERLSRPEEPEPPDPNGGSRSILHIEDNLANLNLMERVLARRSDVRVVAAMQGSLGLELAREHQPVLILLDLHLPDMSGEHVLQRLREDPLTTSIPVVIVSADATTGQVQRLLAAGATAYITKPIDVPHLLGVLDAALSRS